MVGPPSNIAYIQWATKPLQCFVVLDCSVCISTGKNGKNLEKYALDSPSSWLSGDTQVDYIIPIFG
jgi:hypothetical protein